MNITLRTMRSIVSSIKLIFKMPCFTKNSQESIMTVNTLHVLDSRNQSTIYLIVSMIMRLNMIKVMIICQSTIITTIIHLLYAIIISLITHGNDNLHDKCNDHSLHHHQMLDHDQCTVYSYDQRNKHSILELTSILNIKSILELKSTLINC